MSSKVTRYARIASARGNGPMARGRCTPATDQPKKAVGFNPNFVTCRSYTGTRRGIVCEMDYRGYRSAFHRRSLASSSMRVSDRGPSSNQTPWSHPRGTLTGTISRQTALGLAPHGALVLRRA